MRWYSFKFGAHIAVLGYELSCILVALLYLARGDIKLWVPHLLVRHGHPVRRYGHGVPKVLLKARLYLLCYPKPTRVEVGKDIHNGESPVLAYRLGRLVEVGGRGLALADVQVQAVFLDNHRSQDTVHGLLLAPYLYVVQSLCPVVNVVVSRHVLGVRLEVFEAPVTPHSPGGVSDPGPRQEPVPAHPQKLLLNRAVAALGLWDEALGNSPIEDAAHGSRFLLGGEQVQLKPDVVHLIFCSSSAPAY